MSVILNEYFIVLYTYFKNLKVFQHKDYSFQLPKYRILYSVDGLTYTHSLMSLQPIVKTKSASNVFCIRIRALGSHVCSDVEMNKDRLIRQILHSLLLASPRANIFIYLLICTWLQDDWNA